NFWEELLDGHLMPSFDPRRSQTNDVVRQAIIPSSRVGRGGRALVDIWEKEPVLPDNMVTHHWTNSFANLVAAMLADALQEPTYAPLAEKLCSRSGCHALRRRLEETNRIDATYWVCAVSVNQHASICGGYGPEPPEGTPQWTLWDEKRHDSVTQQRFRLCNCEEPKRLSHRDATCELNKFDDMIRFLSQRVTTFEHLLVVDQHFDVLYRAWCVAEIVEGNALGIPAKIKVYSQNAVDCNYDRLSLLDVRQCSASSQEDKDFILQKIGNIQAFNLKLQQLVFSSEGLFSDWVDGKERSRLVGRIWRRSACHSRFLRGHSCSSSEEDLPSDSSGVSTSEASESSELSESGQ
ncbi:Centrosomal protein of 76 kDa, partial [Durusdinium trenchii]